MAFFDGQQAVELSAIQARYVQLLFKSARPLDFDRINPQSGAQTKVWPQVGARLVSASAEYIYALLDAACSQKNLRTYSIPGTLWTSNQLKSEPTVVALQDVAEKRRFRIDVVDHHVDLTIVEEVSKRSAARGNHIG